MKNIDLGYYLPSQEITLGRGVLELVERGGTKGGYFVSPQYRAVADKLVTAGLLISSPDPQMPTIARYRRNY